METIEPESSASDLLVPRGRDRRTGPGRPTRGRRGRDQQPGPLARGDAGLARGAGLPGAGGPRPRQRVGRRPDAAHRGRDAAGICRGVGTTTRVSRAAANDALARGRGRDLPLVLPRRRRPRPERGACSSSRRHTGRTPASSGPRSSTTIVPKSCSRSGSRSTTTAFRSRASNPTKSTRNSTTACATCSSSRTPRCSCAPTCSRNSRGSIRRRSPVPTTSTSAGAPGSPVRACIVAPAARVRHRQATKVEERPTHASDPGDLGAATRSRVRVLYKSYSGLALIWVLPISLLLSVARRSRCCSRGARARRGRGVRGLVLARSRTRASCGERARRRSSLRRIDDGDVRDLMIRGSARVRTFVTLRMHAGERFAVVSERTRTRMDEATRQLGRAPAIIGIILGVLIVFGSRSLFFGRVPAVGGFQEWPGAAASWSTFTAPWRTTMMGSGHAADPVFALMSALQAVLLGHAGLARSLVVTGALPLGTWGVYRLVRPMAGTALPPVAAAVAYGANPLAAQRDRARRARAARVLRARAVRRQRARRHASAEGVDRRHARSTPVLPSCCWSR